MGAHLDERRALGFDLGGLYGREQSVHVLGVLDALHMPTVGVHPRDVVLGVEGDRSGAVDRDPVVVVAEDQLAQAEMSGDRSRFLGDALHHVPVRADRIGVVVHDLVARPVEALAQEALGHRHPNRVGHALTQRTGRDLDARHEAALGVARRARVPLPEALQVLDRQVEAGQVGQRVLQDAGMSRGEHEAVAIAPSGVGWVDTQDMPIEGVGKRRQSHRRAGMTGARLLDGIHRQGPDRVDRELAHLALLVVERRCVQSARFGHCRHMLRS